MTHAGVHPVLVTEATGQIGREVIAQLFGAGVPVRALTRRAATAGLPSAVEVVTGDFTVPESIDAVLQGVNTTLPAEQCVEPVAARAGFEPALALHGFGPRGEFFRVNDFPRAGVLAGETSAKAIGGIMSLHAPGDIVRVADVSAAG